jgi:AcrR family transcriptional regulator
MKENISSKKYDDILITARDLFWKHGFRRVSVDELCKKAGVSKMTFYRYFPNKIELAKTMFISIVRDGQVKFRNIMQEDIPVKEKIKRIIEFKTEATNEISREFMEDFYMGSEPELKAFVDKTTSEVWNSLIHDYKTAQKQGIFRDDFKPEFLVQISFKFVEFLNDEKLTGLYETPQEFILELTNLITYGISPHD